MTGRSRETRLQIMLTEEELVAIDDWRFRQRMPSRASAIRRLINIGLAAAGAVSAEAGVRSQDFGILDESKKKRRGADD